MTSGYMSGHSLGGAMAAFYTSGRMDRYSGIILMAAFPMRGLKAEGFRVLSLYGSEDYVLNRKFYEMGKQYFPEDYTELCIEGGNHAQFGSYGKQKKDGMAEIPAEDQREQAKEAILKLMEQE